MSLIRIQSFILTCSPTYPILHWSVVRRWTRDELTMMTSNSEPKSSVVDKYVARSRRNHWWVPTLKLTGLEFLKPSHQPRVGFERIARGLIASTTKFGWRLSLHVLGVCTWRSLNVDKRPERRRWCAESGQIRRLSDGEGPAEGHRTWTRKRLSAHPPRYTCRPVVNLRGVGGWTHLASLEKVNLRFF